VPDYITTTVSLCQHFFSNFLKIFSNFFVPYFGTQYIGLFYIYNIQFLSKKHKAEAIPPYVFFYFPQPLSKLGLQA